MNPLSPTNRILIIAGIIANYLLTVLTFISIYLHGSVTYAEDNIWILILECYGVFFLGLGLFSYIKYEIKEMIENQKK
jgi:hypothetical protein